MQDYEETPVEVSTPKIHNAADDAKLNSNKKKHAKNPNLVPVMKNGNDTPAATAPIPLLTPEQIEEAKAAIPSQDMADPVAQVEEKEHGRINLMPIGKENTPASQNVPEELAAAQAEAAAEAAAEYNKQAGLNMQSFEAAGPTLGDLSQNQMNNQTTDENMQFDNQNQFTQAAADEPDMFDQQTMPTPSQQVAPAPVAEEVETAEGETEEAEAEPETEAPTVEEVAEQVAPTPKPAKKAEAVAEVLDDEDDFEALVRQRIDSLRAGRRKALDHIEEIENSMIEVQNNAEDLDAPADFREEIAEIMHLSQQISSYNKNIRRYIRVL